MAVLQGSEERELTMTGHANGVLAIWHGVAPENWDDTIAWYDREHHAERVDIPGFVSARRYVAVDAFPRLFICYRTVNADVLSSDAYLARVNNPTPMSLERQPTIVDNTRIVCRVAAQAGRGEGGYVLTMRLVHKADDGAPAASGNVAKLRAALEWDTLSRNLFARRGIVAAELWIADAERTTIPTHEKRLRGAPDGAADVVFVAHGTEAAPLSAALAEEFARERLERNWADVVPGIYRLARAL